MKQFLHEEKIAQTLKPFLKEQGLSFVGIDILGDYLQRVGVLGALLHVETLDEEGAEAPQQHSHERVRLELALRDEAVDPRAEGGDQHHGVEVARVVGRDDRRARRQALRAAHDSNQYLQVS